MELFSDEYFMNEALKQARIAFEEGEIPVGAVIVSKNRIIARAYNQTEKLNDVTAHAEMIAITAAANYMGAKYLPDCKLYVTLEPCTMCGGALFWSQIGTVIFGASDPKRGFRQLDSSILHPKTQLQTGVLAQQSEELLNEFFKKLRK
ncbi:nucleoside deaminase [Algoriphagus zhangzhouensis]|uniref:tRNA-specific adenosine deaminase n=1 Tax=Algoriphagus zhangzhouensis TaxID=1073327 RepID=A0A1M7ZAU8_9BACT|nr:nucleoside deaminase [Algoriphagus zhangzhouensis]TDY47231.1 tRNA(adenine34) deaminase [Algoriphagus zhangzhouensis]SHO61796.1 tRNA(adenine34) deaminase [Algoriphagus zhangzhouensis]